MVIEEMQARQARPPDAVYAAVLVDAIVVKVRTDRSPTGQCMPRSG
jgi:transposase-like protein